MNKFIHFYIFFIFFSSAIAQQHNDKVVYAIGESIIEGDNLPGARQMAIKEALRNAVEKGIGVFISSESYMKNFELIEQTIFANTEGYVKTFEELSGEQFGNRFRIKIKAVVSLDDIKKNLVSISILRQQMHNPRLMIIISTRQGQVDESAISARIQMEKLFVEKHFDLIDPTISKELHNNIKLLLSITQETKIASEIALAHNAEVILTGVIDSKIAGKTNTGFEIVKSNLVLKVIDPTTAKIFSSTKEIGNGLGSNLNEAFSNSGSEVGKKVAQYSSKEIIKWWQELSNSGISYKITLKNVTQYSNAIDFEDVIRSIHNVISLNERIFGGGILECDVIYKGEKSSLNKAIFKRISTKKGFENINVEVGVGNNIIFSR